MRSEKFFRSANTLLMTIYPVLLALCLVASVHANNNNNKVNWQPWMAEFEPHATCYHVKFHCFNSTAIRIGAINLTNCLVYHGPCRTLFIDMDDTTQPTAVTTNACLVLYALVCAGQISLRDMWRYFLVLRQYELDQANGLAGTPSAVVKHWAQLGLKTAHYYNEQGAMRGYRAGDQVEFTLAQYLEWNDLSLMASWEPGLSVVSPLFFDSLQDVPIP